MVNILVIGRTGVGKSTLVNAVLQEKLAKTGHGRPVTKEFQEFSTEGIGVSLADTPGFELSGYPEALHSLEKAIASGHTGTGRRRSFHACWLCIPEDMRRVEEAESILSEAVSRYCPVIGVITKARSNDAFSDVVRRLLPETRSVVRVRALSEELDDGHTTPPTGLVELLTATGQVIDGRRRRTLDRVIDRLRERRERKET